MTNGQSALGFEHNFKIKTAYHPFFMFNNCGKNHGSNLSTCWCTLQYKSLIFTMLYVLTCIRTCCSNCVCLFPAAPPSYAEVVTEEQRQSSLAPLGACDDFERALPGPLFAYIQEFRFLPPPLYSEVSTSKYNSECTVSLKSALWNKCKKLFLLYENQDK